VDAHRPHTRLGEIALAVGDVLVAKALGHQQLNGLAEHLVVLVAEQLSRVLVGADDAARPIDNDDGVGHGLQKAVKSLGLQNKRLDGRWCLAPVVVAPFRGDVGRGGDEERRRGYGIKISRQPPQDGFRLLAGEFLSR
jgi:hypothetical protein